MAAIWIIRHGETEWSASGRHTGLTDIPLTPRGAVEAEQLGGRLREHEFALVLTSPLRRAHATCTIAGFGERAQVDDDLHEWDYGACEGRTRESICETIPGWDLWKDGVPGGESVEQVGQRADRVLARIENAPGDVLLFSHGHLLRILAVRWIGLPAATGSKLALDTASVGVLGRDDGRREIRLWNDTSHLRRDTPPHELSFERRNSR